MKIRAVFELASKSFQLDWEFMHISLPLHSKLLFIVKKYVILLKIFIMGAKEHSSVTVFRKKYFYDDKFGLGLLQATFVDNYFLKNFIRKDAIIIDVGANIGQFNIFCKQYLHSKEIYSFEPVRETYLYLEKNCENHIYNVAISTHKRLTFYLSSLSVWASAVEKKENAKNETVTGKKLDVIASINKLPFIDLLKVDVEGAEKDVILASKKTIKKSKYLLIESSISRDSIISFLDLLNLLNKIVPGIELVRIGKIYNDKNGVTGAADLLFSIPK